MSSSKGISVSPNPVEEGGDVTIKGDAKGEAIVSYNGSLQLVKLDDQGEAVIKAPGKGGEVFHVSDGKFPKASHVTVKVVSSLGREK